jgi:alkylation response protein AidB-like acyl-CoA dehydrogenase
MPLVLSTAVEEIWASANLAFKLCPMLTQGAIEALELVGTSGQNARFLPRMVSGEWTGTMNLTEPHAGSDLGLLKTRAVRDGDRYRLFGQKIFITWGDHDFTDNVIHMVLARVEGAPDGVRGISMFIVPKVLVNDDGTLGERNDVTCISIEHKLGIHASPTCVMAYGQADGAIGYLVGEENRGLEYMFVMMNAARLSVGLEGYAMAERAYQQAADWARTRLQGRPPGWKSREPAPIVHHPDVRRMLLTMKSMTEAMRALALYTAGQLDLAEAHADEGARKRHLARGDLLIPVVKGWCTENGIEIASLGMQIHGGMGYVEETGAAQVLRDARICTIYEGTTGIQSNDLAGRKLARDRGAAMQMLVEEMRADAAALTGDHAAFAAAVDALEAASRSIVAAMGSEPENGLAVSVPFLKLCGIVLGGWLLEKSAAIAQRRLAAGDADREFLNGKVASARFYAAHVLPQAGALAQVVENGAASVIDVDEHLAAT